MHQKSTFMASISTIRTQSYSFVLRMSGPATHTYLPLPPRNLREPPPAYRRPALVSTYSHQPDRSIKHDDSSMMYYRESPEGVDLRYRFDERKEREEDEDEHLDGICEALQNVLEKGEQGERKGGIITWRGMMTR
jgi:RAT1-interacting protein